jgi:hypothetical protein
LCVLQTTFIFRRLPTDFPAGEYALAFIECRTDFYEFFAFTLIGDEVSSVINLFQGGSKVAGNIFTVV